MGHLFSCIKKVLSSPERMITLTDGIISNERLNKFDEIPQK
jgi:hypothetical protein